MKKRLNVLEILGLLLIACSLLTLLITNIFIQKSRTHTAEITRLVEAVLPESTPGFPGEYTASAMPVLQIEETDYAGLLKMPSYGLNLPIANDWNRFSLFSCPTRFYGSVYDGTLIIGGNDLPGQFDFFDRMNPGDRVRITDMTGTEYSFTVDRIDRTKSADFEKLASEKHQLTLFVRSAFSAEYILVRCRFTAQ